MKDCLRFLAVVLILSFAGAASADPCLVVYPAGPCEYHYDTSEYYTAGPGDPYYDSEYDRGGEVLLEVGSNEIDLSIYQAPMIERFVPSTGGNEGYFFTGTDYELIIDGYSNRPMTYVNILVVFDDFVPEDCVAEITVGGMPVVGNVYSAGDLVVSTPTPVGNKYSDTMTIDIGWHGCYGVHVWAYSDEDYSGTHDGGECFTAFSHDATIPTEDSTWGAVKSQYDR
jgi:hypothetical protein